MKFNQFFSKPLALTASISLASLAFAPAVKAFSPSPQSQQPSPSYQIAQGTTTCAVVTGAAGGLHVREKPSTDARIVGALWNGQRVIVGDPSLDGWVAISGPAEGYVFGDYLSYCR